MRLVKTILNGHRRNQRHANRKSNDAFVGTGRTVIEGVGGNADEQQKLDHQHRTDRRAILALKLQADEARDKDNQAKHRQCQEF
jgi:hypothetical protein